MASLAINFPNNNSLVSINCHTHDDLPLHMKGSAIWIPHGIAGKGYYIPPEYTSSNNTKPIKFINHQWYGLVLQQRTLSTRRSLTFAFENFLSLGWWMITDPDHPNYQDPQLLTCAPSRNTFCAPQNINSSSSSGLSTASAHTVPDNSSQNPSTPPTNISTLSLTLHAPMSATATSHSSGGGGGGTAPPTSNNGMRGVPPTIFNGTRTHTDEFWDHFWHYKMVNSRHESMDCLFN